ncbi:arsenate reductase [Helicobacter mustelae]|uniref:arsenate reductase family protein n=1 Tax=Helicobacter mustelae TaxID=217 RepID=UPI000DFC72AA|nr:Spx/MgsR family RNA polymerase-binding regulatory protein [Helicobacter mustelae]STP12614.1 arsenate reductase [Helicobacter mustelae]
MIKVYGIPNCGSVKKAREFLENRGVGYEFVDFKKCPPSKELLESWVKEKGIDVVLNAKGMTYKKLRLKEKNLSTKEKITACLENPSLIKRPVILGGKELIIGFDERSYEVVFC